MTPEFTITEDHLKLVQQANISMNYGETSAPGMCTKRPFGNGDEVWDMGDILGWYTSEEMDADEFQFSDAEYERASTLMKEMTTVLQIACQTLSFEVGTYVKTGDYGFGPWAKKGE